MEKLTKRQNEILTYIKEYIVAHGYPPTVREIGADLGVSSPATIHAHLKNLEEKGLFLKKKQRIVRLNYLSKMNSLIRMKIPLKFPYWVK